jgi:hypothetical protein
MDQHARRGADAPVRHRRARPRTGCDPSGHGEVPHFYRDSAQSSSRDAGQKKTRDQVSQMLQKEFHFAQLHLDRSLDGLMAEMR